MTSHTEALLKRRMELDDEWTLARRAVNEAQAKLTLARRRAKAAEKAYDDSCRTYFAALEAERGAAR